MTTFMYVRADNAKRNEFYNFLIKLMNGLYFYECYVNINKQVR